MKTKLWIKAGPVFFSSLALFHFDPLWGQALPSKTPELLNRGKKIYEASCMVCHGAQGSGETPIAKILKPPPRDFTESLKNWTVSQGDPLKIFRIIKEGIPNSAMVKFNLPDEDIWSLVYTVMSFSKEGNPSDKDR